MTRQAAQIALCLIAAVGCRRDADRPLPRASLYTDVGQSEPEPLSSARGGILERAESRVGAEPDDRADLAAPLPDNVVVSADLSARDEAASQAASDDRSDSRRRGRHAVIDQDWYRLDASDESGLVSLVELRDAPACAVLEAFDDPEKPAWAQARLHRGGRPALPSVRRTATPIWLRVSCQVRKGADREGVGGSYRLAVSTRPQQLDEESEPNNVVGPHTVLVPFGDSFQGTFAPADDSDVLRLDLKAAPPGEALMLSIAGVPDVEVVATLTGTDGSVLLSRRPARGDAIVIPNIDVRRVGDHPLLTLRARSGAAPDSPYAVQVRTYVPGECPDPQACPKRVPIEREPNDEPARAFGIAAGGLITGLIDGPGDADWYEVDGRVGAVVAVTLEPPEGLKLRLRLVLAGEEVVALESQAPGEAIRLPGWRLRSRWVHLVVQALDGAFDRSGVYRLQVQIDERPDFEAESATGADADGTGGIEALVASGDGGWTRSGALVPAGDVDTFILDLRDRTAPFVGRLNCGGDGGPGLRCAIHSGDQPVVDMPVVEMPVVEMPVVGVPVVEMNGSAAGKATTTAPRPADLVPPAAAESAAGSVPGTPAADRRTGAMVVLQPALYRVSIRAEPPRPTVGAWELRLVAADPILDAVWLAKLATATGLPGPATPESAGLGEPTAVKRPAAPFSPAKPGSQRGPAALPRREIRQ